MQRGSLSEFSYSSDVSGRFNSYVHKVSHELRTPLNQIIGFAEIMALTVCLEIDKQNSIESIVTAGHQLEKIISNHIDLFQNILKN